MIQFLCILQFAYIKRHGGRAVGKQKEIWVRRGNEVSTPAEVYLLTGQRLPALFAADPHTVAVCEGFIGMHHALSLYSWLFWMCLGTTAILLSALSLTGM